MSNDFVSQQLSLPGGEMSQLEPTYAKVDSTINMQMGNTLPMSNTYASHPFEIQNQHVQFVDPMSYIPGTTQNLTVLNNSPLPSMEPIVNSMSSQWPLPDQNGGQTNAMLSNAGSQKLIYPNKRKAVEPMSNSSVPQQLSMPNKRVARVEQLSISHEFSNHPSTNRKTGQSMSGASGSQTPAQNKKTGKNESTSNKFKTQRALTPKGRGVQIEAPHKAQTETFGAVRSKMRESLASALALVGQNQNTTPKQEMTSLNIVDKKLESPPKDLRLSESASTPADALENLKETINSKEVSSGDNSNSSFSAFAENATQEGMDNLPDVWKSGGQEPLYNTVVTDGDVSLADSFFAKDELLQGHGLSWEWEINMEEQNAKDIKASQHVGGDGEEQNVRRPEGLALKTEEKEVQSGNHVGVGQGDSCQSLQSPEKLAFEIEAELFKLFGGVNKKYKEKGRSLMFNLKDRNNPELRERVMSGEISPEKLCSMTAEELASKELSEWRTAKAEELAQMIVLPDSDGDRRRLVKKTHKGEYQVEMEQDDGASVEVSFGATALTKIPPKNKERNTPFSSETDELKESKNVESGKGNLDTSYSLTIPADGTDLMQGLIEDEFKDAEFLPPIVSLDEFMESLNAEPPFDNLAVDAGQTKTPLEKVTSETAGDGQGSSNLASKDADTVTVKKMEIDGKITKKDAIEKSSDYLKEHKPSTLDITATAEHVWEGALQLHISALVTVIGLYRSGEKASTKEWPSSLEIKGRVRLDAFEKFLQQLPMSRSRAVMVVHFILKPEASGDDRASLREVIDSYVLDERLGFVEPASGMELYLCPPHPKLLELLRKHLYKDQTEIINATENGLIGVVVWRKAHLSSAISPNSTSHHKHGSKKQQNLISRRPEKNSNTNVNMTSRTPQPLLKSGPLPTNNDDDIPPGFGPGAVRDDDDLPEFNFSGNSNPGKRTRIPPQPSKLTLLNPSQPSRPVDQIRELIQKYGQPGESDSPKTWQDKRPGIQSWNDDDDDDIPEWRPDVPPPQVHLPVHSFQQPVQPYIGNQPSRSLTPHQVVMPPVNMVQSNNPSWQQDGGRWAAPQQGFQTQQGYQAGSLGSQLNVGPFPGGAVPHVGQPPGNWRRDVPGSSRGF